MYMYYIDNVSVYVTTGNRAKNIGESIIIIIMGFSPLTANTIALDCEGYGTCTCIYDCVLFAISGGWGGGGGVKPEISNFFYSLSLSLSLSLMHFRVLSCESCPSCCCFSPQKSSLAFAGNEDGSLVLWDLREPLSMHRPSQLTTPLSPRTHGTSTVTEALARVPTFSTGEIKSL